MTEAGNDEIRVGNGELLHDTAGGPHPDRARTPALATSCTTTLRWCQLRNGQSLLPATPVNRPTLNMFRMMSRIYTGPR